MAVTAISYTSSSSAGRFVGSSFTGKARHAFELAKSIKNYGDAPRLRTYDPALFYLCELCDADKAYEVEEHMNAFGVSLEEAKLGALLKVSAANGRAEKVYEEYLYKLRSSVRCVGETKAFAIEDWFRSEKGSEVGEVGLGDERVKEGILRNGGGWHGHGWVGEGDWVVRRTRVEGEGHCSGCGEQLVCVDNDGRDKRRWNILEYSVFL